MMQLILLSPWKAVGTLPYQADFSKHMQEGVLLPNLTPWFDAQVPGSIYRDLMRAGLIDDPYFDKNSLSCEWVAGRWWIYRTTFRVTKEQTTRPLVLHFGGIDYSAQIYVNGISLGHHEGMYTPFEAEISKFVKPDEENILVCVLEHAPLADAQPGYTSKTRYLKARFNYKWDFAARLMDLGLYEPVTLTSYNYARLLYHFARPVLTNEGWKLLCEAEIEAFSDHTATLSVSLCVKTAHGEVPVQKQVSAPLTTGIHTLSLTLDLGENEPLLWWPNGYGEQVLHDMTMTLSSELGAEDTVSHGIGFRTLSYAHADGREDALRYLVVVNGKRIYLKGTNMVPLDCMHCVDEQEIRARLLAAKEANINYLRIWGGGHLESETYYRICDEYGLMILQEFTMSSSGCDDVPSRNPEFLALLHRAAVHTVKQRRNHVCLTFFDGGNELTDWHYMDSEDHEGHPATFEDSTLAMLKGVLETLCPDVQMLPSSASGPNALLKVGDIGNNHDVHGPWGYMGPYDHYRYYDNSDSIVHGEFGCGGISSFEQIKRIFKTEDQHLCTAFENAAWAHHSGGWDNYAVRERTMFGELCEIPFEEYIKVNQFVQAESLRYSLEANRRRQWKNVGEMTWQFNEPWPNVQCSNVLEYYGGKKLAYYFLREAYARVMVSLSYEKLFYQAGESFTAGVHIINDGSDAPYTITCTVKTEDGRVLCTERFLGKAKEDVSICCGQISVQLPDDLTGGFSVVLESCCGKVTQKKEYLMLMADLERPVSMSETEKLAMSLHKFRPRQMDDGKRADWRVVSRYVDRMKTLYQAE